MLNDQLLEAFMMGFYGFGTYRAQYWFIGMEEGGGNSSDAISRQLEIWDKSGRQELLDVAEYAREMNITKWYGDRPRLQPTWKHLIRVFLSAENQPVDSEFMRSYQKNHWGTRCGDTCLLELLPLPAPNTSSWIYKDISSLPFLINRRTYREYVAEFRMSHLRKKIIDHSPRAVVFYGSGYDEYWKSISKTNSWETSETGVLYKTGSSTTFISAMHPVAHGATNEYFLNIGRFIADPRKLTTD